jgi:hypothetical protein
MVDRAAAWVNDFLDRVVGRAERDADTQRQAKRVAGFTIAYVFWTFLFGAVYTAFGAPISGVIVFAASLPIFGSLVAVRCGFSPAVAGNMMCVSGWCALTGSAVINGGWTSSALFWYSTIPVASLLTSGAAWGLVWTLIPLASIAGLAACHWQGIVFANELSPSSQLWFACCVLAGLVACQFILAWLRVGLEQRALMALQETNASLIEARKTLALLKAGFGFSMDDWAKLQREKAALERFVRLRFGDADVAERDVPEDAASPAGPLAH